MKQSLISTVLLVVVFVVGLNAWVWLQQASMLFFPLSGINATPADWGMAYEEVELKTEDGVTIHGWYVPSPGSDKVLLFFHGNAGNISHRGDSLGIFHRLGLNVLIIDYRGYGKSRGKPSEAGLYADARAAWAYLREEKKFDADRIVLFGRSLGGAVAARLATEVKPAALILESTFSSARDVAKEMYPILSKLIILRFAFDTARNVKSITCPVLVMHSPEDEIIPYRLGQRVYKAANAPKTMLQLEGSHNLGFMQSQPEYQQGIRGFLTRDVYSEESNKEMPSEVTEDVK